MREKVGHENGVVLAIRNGVLGAARCQEITRNQLCALMNELVKGMLPIRARLAPDDGPGGVIDMFIVSRRRLAIRLHIALVFTLAHAVSIKKRKRTC